MTTSGTGKRVAVVGAGIAGLTAAWRLQQAGWQVTVFEQAPYAGGRTRTVRLGDCTVDLGATVLLSGYTDTLNLVRDLELEAELEEVSGAMAIPRDGQMHLLDPKHPLRDMLKLSALSAGSKLSLVKLLPPLLAAAPHLNYEHLGGASGHDRHTLTNFCQGRFPAEVHDYLLEPMLKFLYIHNGQQGSLLELLWWMKAMGLGETRALARGTNSLTGKMAEQLDVRCDTEVVSVEHGAQGVRVSVRTDGHPEPVTTHFDRCLVTTPGTVAARIAPSALTTRQAAFLASRRYNMTTVVTFCTSQRPALDALMMMIPERLNSDLATLVFQHQVAPQRTPANKGVVNAYFMHDWSQRHLAADDATVVEAARQVVQALVPEVAQCDAHNVHRWQHTAALTAPGDCASIQAFVDETRPEHPVQFIGDYLVQASLNVAVSAAERVVRRWTC